MKEEIVQYERIREFDRICAYIDLDAAVQNLRNLHMLTQPGVKIAAVVKADGYGHGSVALAKAFEDEEYLWGYATATVEEAMQLRKYGIQKPILILGYSFSYCYETLAQNEIRTAVFTTEMAKELSAAAVKVGKTIKVHVKVDTGMGRIGISPGAEGVSFVREVSEYPGLEIEGVFTHFAKADEADKSAAMLQYARFTDLVERIERELDLRIPMKHCANSAAIMELPEVSMDMVRAGIAMYGLWPSDEVGRDMISLKPILSLKSHVSFVKAVQEGCSISYGGIFTAKRPMKVATVPVGYADGYPRMLTGRGSVLIRGIRCAIVGRICMDQFMVDVTDLPDCMVGEEVILLGESGSERITAEEIGALSGRFNYEFVCCINKRVPRVYIKDGVKIAYADDFSED